MTLLFSLCTAWLLLLLAFCFCLYFFSTPAFVFFTASAICFFLLSSPVCFFSSIFIFQSASCFSLNSSRLGNGVIFLLCGNYLLNFFGLLKITPNQYTVIIQSSINALITLMLLWLPLWYWSSQLFLTSLNSFFGHVIKNF